MTQKIAFQKSEVTIDEILKAIIRSKKVNLSYSPDALNLREVIYLPHKEVSIRELLSLISNKTGNRLIITGNQVVIKKGKITEDKLKKEKLSVKGTTRVGEDTLIKKGEPDKPAPIPELLLPKNRNQVNLSLKQFSRPSIEGREVLSLNYRNKKEDLSKLRTSKSKKKNRFTFSAGSCIELAQLAGVSDSGKNIKPSLTLGWGGQTDLVWRLDKSWQIETGVGFRQTNYSINWGEIVWVNLPPSYQSDSSAYYRYSPTEKRSSVKLCINSVEIPLIVSYILKTHKNSLIFGTGINTRYILAGKGIYTTPLSKIEDDISLDSSNIVSFFYLNKLNYYLLGKIGYQYKRWELSASACWSINPFTKENSGRPLQIALSLNYQILPSKKYSTR